MTSALAPPAHSPVGGNICAVVERGAALFGERAAIAIGDTVVSYAELRHRIRTAARELIDLGLEPGERVVSLSPNCIELLVISFAVPYLGGVSVPLNPMLQGREIAVLLARVDPALFFVHPTYAEAAREATKLHGARTVDLLNADTGWSAGSSGDEIAATYVTSDGPATIVFTSGSTSTPKGCVKSHSNYLWSAVNHQMSWPRTGDDNELYAIPLSGIGFANLVMGPLLGGATIVLERFAAPATLDAMERRRTTCTFLPATMLDSLLREEERSGTRDLSAMRLIQTSYSMSVRLRARIAERFPGIVHYSYGLTEGSMSSAREPHRFLDDPTCVGMPCGIDAFAILDSDGRTLGPNQSGEIVVAGPDVMMGYLDDTQATSEALRDGWLHTGDLGYLDEGGALHFVGRVKDVIKSGGVNIAAAEVEQYLTSHDAVHDAAIVGIPDDHWGEAVAAFVEIEPGHEISAAALADYCRNGLAKFKRPKSIAIVDQLPRNPSGKVAKDKLRSSCQQEQAHEECRR